MTAGKLLFISRAGADAAFAEQIARILEAAGYEVILAQRDFANRNLIGAHAPGAHPDRGDEGTPIIGR